MISTTNAAYLPYSPGGMSAYTDERVRALQRSGSSDSTGTQSTTRTAVGGQVATSASQRVGAGQRSSDLNSEEQAVVEQLASRDREVRAHERAHQSAGGGLTGSASFTYERGPDGRMYATGGEVSISVPSSSGDPEKDLETAQTVIRAALAPAEPSGQDLRVAADARTAATEAQIEIGSRGARESEQRQGAEESDAAKRQDARGSGYRGDAPVSGAIPGGNEAVAAGNARRSSTIEQFEQRLAEREALKIEFERRQQDDERRAEALDEYLQRMDELQQSLYELNQKLASNSAIEGSQMIGQLVDAQA